MVAALLSVALCSLLTIALLFALFAYSPIQPYSREVALGVFYMLPGLWCFAINKVLLNALNGRQHNKLYALFVSLRYLLVLLFFLGAVWYKIAAEKLPVILTLSEAALLLAIGLVYPRFFHGRHALPRVDWLWRHIHFGARSILGGIAVELNTRIDVLVLGIFATDAAVGIYSFAAFFIEGFLQLSMIARRLVDPMLTRLAVQNDVKGRAALLVRGRNLGAACMTGVTVTMAITYPWYAAWLGSADIAKASWVVFVILAVGACIFAVYAAFGGILSQSGLPMLQTWLNLAILGTNLALNLALVPIWDMLGAAIGTSLSFAAGTLYLRFLVLRYFNVRF
jgi:O-antigen/teichoic acid export membrane protein